MAKIPAILLLSAVCLLLTACPHPHAAVPENKTPLLQSVDLTDPSDFKVSSEPITLSGADNERLDFAVQVAIGEAGISRALRFHPPVVASGSTISFKAFQILPVPVDLNRADFIRQTGRSGENRQIPRVLFPLISKDGIVALDGLHDPTRSTLLWIELEIPPKATPGDYKTSCDLIEKTARDPIASLPLHISINDFTLPPASTLQVAGRLDWSLLQKIYPHEFEGITPRLLNRRDPRYSSSIHILDQLVQLARDNGAVAFIPALQPTVKWPPGTAPHIDWTDFDSLLSPWLDGNDPLAYWPLPSPDFLDRFDADSQAQYWKLAAEHFEKKGWLTRAPAVLSNESQTDANSAQSIVLCALANRALAAHPHLRVQLPLEDQQIKSGLIDPKSLSRIISLCPGAVSSAGSIVTPDRQHWLSSSRQTSNDLYDVRSCWLAFLGDASLIVADDSIMTDISAGQRTDSSAMIWFYPGQLLEPTNHCPRFN